MVVSEAEVEVGRPPQKEEVRVYFTPLPSPAPCLGLMTGCLESTLDREVTSRMAAVG